MFGYAPYDNVAALDYPPILAETSLNDTRVLYVEPAKWVARLRATATGRRDFLLKTEMSAGHGGVSGRYKAWHDRAFSLAWILDRMGLAEAGSRPTPEKSLRVGRIGNSRPILVRPLLRRLHTSLRESPGTQERWTRSVAVLRQRP